ncbi:MAG TPA: oligosaccharide flippase family protein [Polyangia bacterium]|nr:oligosaccharide flippase family protein [Polyangia bacterium]
MDNDVGDCDYLARPKGGTLVRERFMGHAKTIARNSLWSLADSLLGMVSSFGCSIAVARVMGPDQLGYYNVVTWMANMAAWIAAFGIPAATRTYAAEAFGRGDHALARAIVEITSRIQLALGLTAVAVGLVVVFIAVPPVHRTFAILAVISILPYLMYPMPTAGITATEDLAPVVRASLISTVVIGGGTAVALVFGWGLVGLTTAMLASRVVDFGLRQYFYQRIYRTFPAPPAGQKLPPELKRRLIEFCKQATFMTVLEIVVWERSEVFFLQHFSTMAEVSFFTQPFNWVSQWLLLLPRIISVAAGASIAVQQGRDPSQTAGLAIGSTRVLMLLILPAAFGLSALASPIITVLLGAKYLPSIGVFAFLAVMTLGKGIQLPARQLLVSTGRQHLLVRWGVVLCAVNLVLDLVLIPGRGSMGAAIAKGIILMAGGASIWWIVAVSFRARLPLAVIARMAIASAAMWALVRTIVAVVPPLPALVLGPPAGIIAIVVLFRVLRCLEPSDREVLASLGRKLPAAARPAWGVMVGFMFPTPPPTATPGAA